MNHHPTDFATRGGGGEGSKETPANLYKLGFLGDVAHARDIDCLGLLRGVLAVAVLAAAATHWVCGTVGR